MALQQITLTNDPNHSFRQTIQINGENVVLLFNLRYNKVAQYWVMTITDEATGDILLDSLPLVSGGDITSDLLFKYGYLEIGAAYFIPSVTNPTTDFPNDQNIGTEFALAWDDNIWYIG